MRKQNKTLNKKRIYMNRKTGHPSRPFYQSGKKVKSVGFTSDGKEIFGKKTKLQHNINPDSKAPCFVKNDIEHFSSLDYKEIEKYMKYRVHKDDEVIINKIIRDNSKKDRSK